MDFTIKKYEKLLASLISEGYAFQTFEEFIKNSENKVVVLRHDVDELPQNSLRFAEIQNKYGIKAVYYFRAVPQSWDVKVIKEIHEMGHEVGYHYETMDTAGGEINEAYEKFKFHLKELRKLTKVTTICMHGSPRSKFDNKDLWNKFDYKHLGLIGEPYFDIDFNKVLYLTDTGRRWDGHKVSVRDKVQTNFNFVFHSTVDIITALEKSELPKQIMFNFHPQRWHSNKLRWTHELIVQNLKNLIKRYFFVSKN